MQVDELPAIDPHVDYTQILPIQQKRTIAFINNFLMSTVSFLNTFAQSCESRLMDYENKLQKVEASLMILESQLSSIAGLDDDVENNNVVSSSATDIVDNNVKEKEQHILSELPDIPDAPSESKSYSQNGVKACEHPVYMKFFKMVQFGVPPPAVKLKMQNEGIDPDILDTPNQIIEDLNDTSTQISSPTSSL